MKQEYLMGILVVIAALVIWYFFLNKGPYDSFAQCLNQKGVIFYGAFWCPHCAAEKALFGNSFHYMKYVECSNQDYTETKACVDANVKSYPTWHFANGTQMSGEIPLQQLSDMTECTLANS